MAMQASMGSGGRPIAITVICVVMAILTVLALIGLLTAAGLLMEASATAFIYSIISVIVTAACIYGFWFMKKWALHLYSALFVIGIIISLMTAGVRGALIGQIVPLIILAVCWYYRERMT
jgi:hypothetical protein